MNGMMQHTPEQESQKTPMIVRDETVAYAEMFIDAALLSYAEERTVSASALKDTVEFKPDFIQQAPAAPVELQDEQTKMADDARSRLDGLFN